MSRVVPPNWPGYCAESHAWICQCGAHASDTRTPCVGCGATDRFTWVCLTCDGRHAAGVDPASAPCLAGGNRAAVFNEPPRSLALERALELHLVRKAWAAPAGIEEAKTWLRSHPGATLGDALLARGVLQPAGMAEVVLARAYSEILGWPFMDVASKPPLAGAARLMPRALAVQHRVVPIFAHQHRIVLATDRPVSEDARRALRAHFGRELDWAMAPRASLDKAIAQAFAGPAH